MNENSIAKFKGGELKRTNKSIAITKKLLSQNKDLKILIIYIDNIVRNALSYNLANMGGFEIDDAEISETNYETAIIKAKQKKYNVILITTMYNSLEITARLRENNDYENTLIYILSIDRSFCIQNSEEHSSTGFIWTITI